MFLLVVYSFTACSHLFHREEMPFASSTRVKRWKRYMVIHDSRHVVLETNILNSQFSLHVLSRYYTRIVLVDICGINGWIHIYTQFNVLVTDLSSMLLLWACGPFLLLPQHLLAVVVFLVFSMVGPLRTPFACCLLRCPGFCSSSGIFGWIGICIWRWAGMWGWDWRQDQRIISRRRICWVPGYSLGGIQ